MDRKQVLNEEEMLKRYVEVFERLRAIHHVRFHLIEMYESTGHNERIYFEASENQTEQETTLWNYIEGRTEEY